MSEEIHKNIKYINNKFGDESWVPALQINNLIRDDNIMMYRDCFMLLNSQVKIRILMSMLHLSTERLEKLEDHFSNLIEVSLNDTDPWVKVTAGILRYFPVNRQLNKLTEFPNGSKIISQIVDRLDNSESKLMPLECRVVSKSNVNTMYPDVNRTVDKHFQLKRKPKSAALRAELLQRSLDTYENRSRLVSNSKSSLSRQYSENIKEDDRSTPFMSLNTHRRGQASQNRRHSGAYQSREGGTKMIAIEEAPSLKKEKKRKSKKEKEEHSTDSDNDNKKRRDSRSSAASGCDSLTSPKLVARRRNSSISSNVFSPEDAKRRRNSSAYDSSDSAASTSPYRGKASRKLPTQQKPSTSGPQSEQQFQPFTYSTEANYAIKSEDIQQQRFVPEVPPPAQPKGDEATNLALTKDQMQLASDLFQNPRLSSEDKQTILRFLAANGKCENPNPQLGPVHRYSLREETEKRQNEFGQDYNVSVEHLFQLNYETGKYEKLHYVQPTKE